MNNEEYKCYEFNVGAGPVSAQKNINKYNAKGITLVALIITTIFSYDENSKFSNNKGFLLKAI